MARSVSLALAMVFLLQPAVLALVGPGSPVPPAPDEGPQAEALPPGFGQLCFRAVNGLRDDLFANGTTAAPAPEVLVVAKPARTAPLALADDLLLNTPSDALVTDAQGTTPPWPLPPGPAVVAAVDPWGWYRPLALSVNVRPAASDTCDYIELRLIPAARPLPLTVPSLTYNGNDLVKGLGATTPGAEIPRDPHDLGAVGPVPALGPMLPEVEGDVCLFPNLPVQEVSPLKGVNGNEYPKINLYPNSQSCVSYRSGTVCATTLPKTPGMGQFGKPILQQGPGDGPTKITASATPVPSYVQQLTGQGGDGDVCRKEPDQEGEVGFLQGKLVDGSVLGGPPTPLRGISVALQLVAEVNPPAGLNLDLRGAAKDAGQGDESQLGALITTLKLDNVPIPNPGATIPVDPSGTGRLPDDPNSLPLVAVRRAYEALAPPAEAGLNLGDHRDDRYRYADRTNNTGEFLIACHRLGDAGRGNSLSLAFVDEEPSGRSLHQSFAHAVVPATGDCIPGQVTELGTLRMLRTGVINVGTIRHANTEAPLGDVEVTATNTANTANGTIAAQPGSVRSDLNGTYSIKIPWTNRTLGEGAFDLKAQKPGFQPYEAQTSLAPEDVPTFRFPNATKGARDLTEAALQFGPTLAGIADERLLNALQTARRTYNNTVLNALAGQPPAEQNTCTGATASACQSYQQALRAGFQNLSLERDSVQAATLLALDAGLGACRAASDNVTRLGPDLGLDAGTAATIAPVAVPAFENTTDQRADAAAALDACDQLLKSGLLASASALDALERALVGRYLDRVAGNLSDVDALYVQQAQAAFAALDDAVAMCTAAANPAPATLDTCRAAADLLALARGKLVAAGAGDAPSENLGAVRANVSLAQAALQAALGAKCGGLSDAAPACAAVPDQALRLAHKAAFDDLQGSLNRAELALVTAASGQKALGQWLRNETALRVSPYLDLAEARGPVVRQGLQGIMADPAAGPLLQQLRSVAVLLEGGDPAAVLLAIALHDAASQDALAPAEETGEVHRALDNLVEPPQDGLVEQVDQAFEDFGVRLRDIDLKPKKEPRRVVDLLGNPIVGAAVCLKPLGGAEDCAYITVAGGFLAHPSLPGVLDVVEPGVYNVAITGPSGLFEPRSCDGIEIPVVQVVDAENLQHSCWVLLHKGNAGLVVKTFDRRIPERRDTENMETGLCGATLVAVGSDGQERTGLTACATAPQATYRDALAALHGLQPFTNGTGVVEVPVAALGSNVQVVARHPGYYQETAPVVVAGLRPGMLTDVLEQPANALPAERTTENLRVVPRGNLAMHAAYIPGATLKISEATWILNATTGTPTELDCTEDATRQVYGCGAQIWTDDPFGLGWPVGGAYQLKFLKDNGLLYRASTGALVELRAPLAGNLAPFERNYVNATVETRHGRVMDAHNDTGLQVAVNVTRAKAPACDDTVPVYDCVPDVDAKGDFTVKVPDYDGLDQWDLAVNTARQGYNTTTDDLTVLTSADPGAVVPIKLSRRVVETKVRVTDQLTGTILPAIKVTVTLDGGATRCFVNEDVAIACSNVTQPDGNATLWLPWGSYDVVAGGERRSLNYNATFDAPGLPGADALKGVPIPVYDDANFTTTTVASDRDRLDTAAPTVGLAMARLQRDLAGTVMSAAGPVAGATVRAHPLLHPAANYDPVAFCGAACTGLAADAQGAFAAKVPDVNYRLAPVAAHEMPAAAQGAYQAALNALNVLAAAGGSNGITANLTFLSRLPEVWQVTATAPGHAGAGAYAVHLSPAEAPLCNAGPLDDGCAPLQQPLAECTRQTLPDEVPAVVDVCPQEAVELVLNLLPKAARTTFVVTRAPAFGTPEVFDGAVVCVSHITTAQDMASELQKALLLEHLTDVPLLQLLHDRFGEAARSNCRRTDAQGRVAFDLTREVSAQELQQVQQDNDAIVFVERDTVRGTPPWVEAFKVTSQDQVLPIEVLQPFPLEVPNNCSPSPSGAPEACINAPAEGTPRSLRAVFVDEATRAVLGPAPGAWLVKGPDLTAPPIAKPGSANLAQLDLQAEGAGRYGDGTWTVLLAPNAAPARTLVRFTYVADGLPPCTSPDLRVLPKTVTSLGLVPPGEGMAAWAFTATADLGCKTAATAFEPDVEPDGLGLRFHLGATS